MFDKPIISFCIPTFNRGNKLYELVEDILKFSGNEIEVVVVDNLSTDNTVTLLSTIDDKRLSLVVNKVNIGGPANLLNALSMAKGEYAFLCLDKDRIDYRSISNLISRMEYDKNVVFGHCILNCNIDGVDTLYEQGFSSVINMSYLSQHPTGTFYKTSIFKEIDYLSNDFMDNDMFGFHTDLINGKMSFYGKSKIINLPLFYTETKEDCAETSSFTYKNIDDVFFSPPKRFHEFLTYAESATKLDLLTTQKKVLISKLFKQGLIASTVGYKAVLKDSFVCAHYSIEPQVVSIIELMRIDFKFCYWFLKCNLPIGSFQKLIICAHINYQLLFNGLLSKR